MIFWLLRRSEEPSPTEILCYWKKSLLSTVKGIKSKTVDELSLKSTVMKAVDDRMLKEFIALGKDCNRNAFIIRYSEENRKKITLYVDHLFIAFTEAYPQQITVENFTTFCVQEMTPDRCLRVHNETLDQSSKSEWYYQRYARITASKLYECSRCQTSDGSLVASIMGARKFKGNIATERGLKLEAAVFDIMKKKHPDLQKSGIILRSDFPFFGASPDGVSDHFVLEIKCPLKEETIKNYVKEGVLQDKVFFQIQCQMLLCDKTKGLLCVADPNFEKNQKVYEYEVSLDKRRLLPVIDKCRKFWGEIIFENLK